MASLMIRSAAVAIEFDAVAALLECSTSTVRRRAAKDEAALVASVEAILDSRKQPVFPWEPAPTVAAIPAAIPAPVPTVCPMALANGAAGKDSVHSRRSMEQQKGRTVAVELPTVAGGGIINRANRIVLKDKKELRAELTAAVKALGGTRYTAGGFADSTAFLSGFPFAPTAGVGDKARMVIRIHPTGANFKVEPGSPSPIAELVIYADGSWKVA